MRSKEVEKAIEKLNKDILVDECWKNHDIGEIFKEYHIWSLKTLLAYIEELEKDVEKYMKLSASSLARGLNESIRSKEKNKTELDLLNEGWKASIRDKQIQREFELQQKYKDFDKDPEWLRYQELLEGK